MSMLRSCWCETDFLFTVYSKMQARMAEPIYHLKLEYSRLNGGRKSREGVVIVHNTSHTVTRKKSTAMRAEGKDLIMAEGC